MWPRKNWLSPPAFFSPQEPITVQLVDKITSGFKAKLGRPIGFTAVPLDARFTTIRAKESNLANFVLVIPPTSCYARGGC